MTVGLAGFVASRVAGLRRRVARMRAREVTRRSLPELMRAYAAFGAALQISSGRQPFKGWDLWRLLEDAKPRSIAEMGSGTTSAVFSLWSLRHPCKYVAYESSANWTGVAQRALSEAGLGEETRSPIRHVATRVSADGNAVGFVEPIPTHADFVYIDGPPCILTNGRKVANDDIVRLFETGGLPRTIVIDGRIETVDLVRAHAAAARYRFEPSFAYCHQHRLWSAAMLGREHSRFSLIADA